MGIEAAIIGAAVLGTAGSAMAASASKKAGQQQADAQTRAAELQAQQAAQARGDLAPWRQTGEAANLTLANLLGLRPEASMQQAREMALAEHRAAYGVDPDPRLGSDMAAFDRRIQQLYGELQAKAAAPAGAGFGSLAKPFTPADLTQEPGYQFTLGEGEKAINRAAAARGMWASGPTLKALTRFNQGLAGTTYQDAWSRDAAEKARLFGMYSDVSGRGQSSAAQTGTLGANYASMIGGNIAGAGASQAGGTVGAANAWNSGLGQIGQSAMDYYTLNEILKRPQTLSNPGSDWGYRW
jgi:hypothetical protein